MSTRILILKDGVITPAKTSADSNAIVNSLGTSLVTSVNGSTGAITLTKSSVGLSSVDNTSDLSKPISTLTQNALNNKADLVGGLIPSSQIPGSYDDVLEFATLSSFPTTGESGKIYVAIDTHLTYRWSGSVYSNMSPSLALGITSTTAYRGDYGNIAYNHSQIISGNPHGLTAATLNLGNVTNTSDANKPVSIAQQSALDLKANLISPALSGTPTAPTATAGTSTTQIATTAFVINAVAGGGSTTTYVDLTTNQTINGTKIFNGILQLPNNSGTLAGSIWRSGDNLEYKDSSNVTKIILNSAGNLSNLANKQTALNNLVGTQTANRVLRSNGVNVVLAQIGLTTDVTDILPIANGGTGSSTQNWVDITSNQTNIGGNKTFTGIINLTNSTASTSTTTGALLVSGGIGVGGTISADSGYFLNAVGAGNQTFDFTNSGIKCGIGTVSQDAVFSMHVSGSGLGVFGFDVSDLRFVIGSQGGRAIDFCTNVGGTPGADNFVSASPLMKLIGSNIVMPTLPTSSAGLSSGMLWRNGNVVNIV